MTHDKLIEDAARAIERRDQRWDIEGAMTPQEFATAALAPTLALLDEANNALFGPVESDASLNLQGVAQDLQKFDDRGICLQTVKQVIGQLERARAALAAIKGTDNATG